MEYMANKSLDNYLRVGFLLPFAYVIRVFNHH